MLKLRGKTVPFGGRNLNFAFFALVHVVIYPFRPEVLTQGFLNGVDLEDKWVVNKGI